MNIKLYGTGLTGREYGGYRTSSVSDPVKRQTAEPVRSYDQLTLHQTQYPSDAGQFAKILAKEVAKEVSAPVDSSRVEELRRQVASGAYTPNAELIARHMLCYS